MYVIRVQYKAKLVSAVVLAFIQHAISRSTPMMPTTHYQVLTVFTASRSIMYRYQVPDVCFLLSVLSICRLLYAVCCIGACCA